AAIGDGGQIDGDRRARGRGPGQHDRRPGHAVILRIKEDLAIHDAGCYLERTEKAIGFGVAAGREKEGLWVPRLTTVAKLQGPETVNGDKVPPAVLELPKESAVVGIVEIDVPVAEIPH